MSDKRFMFVILMLVMVPLAFAESSFTFYSGAGVDQVCPRSTGLFSDVIENNGDEVLELSVSSSGSAAVFATTVPIGFVLFPGEIRNIYTYVTPMSSVDVGNYVLTLTANGNGISQEITHSLFVKDCYDYDFVANDVEKHVCPCDDDKFSFTLTNKGEYSEFYLLGVDGEYKNNIVLSQNSLTLAPGASKEIFAYAQSDCEDQGDYEFSIIVDPSKGRSIKSQTAKLVVDACYDFDIDTERDLINMCEHSTENVAINVRNDGSSSNVYDLSLDGPLWANLENNKLSVGAGTSGSVNLELIPDYGVEGSFQITFKAVPEKGTVQAVNIFNVNVKKCHEVSVIIEKSEDMICNALENTYGVVVRNQGEFSKDFYVDVEGPSWASLDFTSVSLGAGEEKQLTLSVSPSYDVSAGSYDIDIAVSAKDSNKIASSDSINIQTVTREECYDASLSIEEGSIDVYYDASATVPVVIENKGADVAAYSLSVSGTASNFVYLNPSVIDVLPGESEIVYLYIAPSDQVSEGDYSTTVTVRLEDSTIMASDSVNIKITDVPTETEEVTPEGSPERESLFSRIIAWISNLFGGGDEVIEEVSEEEVKEESSEEPVEDISEEEPIEEGPIEEEPVEEDVPEEEPIEEDVPEEEPIEEEDDEEEVESTDVLLGVGDSTKFMINEDEHTIKVETVSDNTVLLEIRSNPIFVPLEVGDVKRIDIDGDKIEDIEVSFSGFVGNKADISYTVLEGAGQGESDFDDIVEDVPEDESSEGSGFFAGFFESLGAIFNGLISGVATYQIQLIVLIVLIIVILLLAKTNLWGKITNFFEEEIEEEKIVVAEKPVEEKKEDIVIEEEKPKEEPKKEEKKEIKKKEKKVEEDDEDEFVIEFDDDDK
ncbi:hypothetical protein K8R33_02320 [archaeon]|nr:hypothetical protein [archaeon]